MVMMTFKMVMEVIMTMIMMVVVVFMMAMIMTVMILVLLAKTTTVIIRNGSSSPMHACAIIDKSLETFDVCLNTPPPTPIPNPRNLIKTPQDSKLRSQ